MRQCYERVHPDFMRLYVHFAPSYLARMRQVLWQTTLTAIISRKIEDLDKARALLALLAQGEVISFSDSIGDPVYFCSHCDPGSNEHEPVCPILQAKTLGIEVTE